MAGGGIFVEGETGERLLRRNERKLMNYGSHKDTGDDRSLSLKSYILHVPMHKNMPVKVDNQSTLGSLDLAIGNKIERSD